MKDFDTDHKWFSSGLDQMFQAIDAVVQMSNDPEGRPYNIERVGKDGFVLELSVAGFRADDLEVSVEDGKLSIISKITQDESVPGRNIIHRGISRANFKCVFQMTQYLEVTGSRLENGLLLIDMKDRMPDLAKKKIIPVTVV